MKMLLEDIAQLSIVHVLMDFSHFPYIPETIEIKIRVHKSHFDCSISMFHE
jgi:hypothetical protein